MFAVTVMLNLSIVVLFRYVEKNTRCHSLYRPYSHDVPVYLHDKPKPVIDTARQKISLLKKFLHQTSKPQEAMVSSGSKARMQTNVGTCYHLEKRSTSHSVSAYPGYATIFHVNTFLPYSGTFQNGDGKNYHSVTGIPDY